MKLPAWVIGVGLAVAVGGGAVAFTVFNQQRATEAEIGQLLASAKDILDGEQLDPGAAQSVLREIRGHALGSTDARMILAQARLLLVLGRLQPAWDTLATLVLALEPEPAEMLVGAKILKRLHGLRGDQDLAGQAADLAEGHFEETDEVGSAFLAWQCARRAGRVEAAEALREKLSADFGETAEAKLVLALAADTTTVGDLVALEIDFGGRRGPLDGPLPPEEIDFAIAFLLLKAGDQGQVDEAINRLERVLRTLAGDADTRHLLAFALHQAGDQKKRDSHLDWLLENAPAEDARRDTWRSMRQQPASGR